MCACNYVCMHVHTYTHTKCTHQYAHMHAYIHIYPADCYKQPVRNSKIIIEPIINDIFLLIHKSAHAHYSHAQSPQYQDKNGHNMTYRRTQLSPKRPKKNAKNAKTSLHEDNFGESAKRKKEKKTKKSK